MAIVDFTTFTTDDPNNFLTVTATKITVASALSASYFTVYKDYGATYFGDFVHRVEIQVTSGQDIGGGNAPYWGGWGVSATSFTINQMSLNNEGFNARVMDHSTLGPIVAVYDEDSNNFGAIEMPATKPSVAYMQFERVGATFRTTSFRNADYSATIDTEWEDAFATNTFPYLLPSYGIDISGSDTIDGYVKHLDIDIDFAYEDFMKYTEVDSSKELLVSTNQIDFTTLAIDEDVYVTKDFGFDYFSGDFVHRFKVHFESATFDGGNAGQCTPWAMTNTDIHTLTELWAGTDGIFLQMYRSGAAYWFNLDERMTGSDNSDFWQIPSVPVTYYLEVERSGTTVTVKIYSDAYSTLEKTMTMTATAGALRYITPLAGMGGGADADTITGYTANYQLVSGEVGGPQPPYEDFTTYTEVDEGTNIIPGYTSTEWISLNRTHTSRVYKDFGVDYFSGDFIHTFEVQMSDGSAVPMEHEHWTLANTLDDFTGLSAGDQVSLGFYTGDNTAFRLYLHLYEGGVWKQDNDGGLLLEDTTYFITIERDQNGGANGTGQYVATIRTGSHVGTVIDTLSVDASAGEQRSWRYYYSLNTIDSGASSTSDGFTRNVTLLQTGGIVRPNFRMTRASQQDLRMYGPPSTGMGLTS